MSPFAVMNFLRFEPFIDLSDLEIRSRCGAALEVGSLPLFYGRSSMMRALRCVLGMSVLVFGCVADSWAQAVQTPTLGRSPVGSPLAPGVTPGFNLTCAPGHRVTGIKAESSGDTILRIGFVCTAIGPNGGYLINEQGVPVLSSSGWSGELPANLSPAPILTGERCPDNFYVVGINAYLAVPPPPPNTLAGPQYAQLNQYIRRIQFGCLAANGKRIAIGNPPVFREIGTAATGGAWAFPSGNLPDNRRCPVGGIGFGLKGVAFSGLRTLSLVCDY
jgi:hypothetical protein